jgi:transcription factor IIIB subunit 2
MASCQQCGQDTDWDDDLGTAVCTVCGTLADPSQSALVSHLDQHDNSARQYDMLPIPTSSTLRSRQGWHLAGQGKPARDMKNNVRRII